MSVHATVDTRSPTTIADTDTHTTDHTLRRLEQVTDEYAVDALLQSFLARRRAVRQACREQAAEQVRREHELLVHRTVLAAGLTHLR